MGDHLFAERGQYAKAVNWAEQARVTAGATASVRTRATQLQQPDEAGDLMVSSLGADPDGDGLVDRLLAFGARSVGLRDATGADLWSSGERLAGRAAALDPAAQRAAATMGGLRPTSLALGEAGGARFLAAVLEGPGAVVALDLTAG